MKPPRYYLNAPRGAQIRVLMVAEDNHPIAAGDPLAKCNTPELARDFWRENVATASWFEPEKECLVVLVLDRKNQVKAWNLVSLGTATGSLVHPREVFRPVLVAAGTACLVMHNHPLGDPAPSSADLQVTHRMREASQALDVELLDHVVIGDPAADPTHRGYYSFREAGLL
jgi:DNA repair protein RadC